MEKSGCDRLFIHLEIRKDDRHTERMDNVRFPGFSLLVFMGIIRKLICLLDHAQIIGRMVLSDAGNKIPVKNIRTCEISRRFQLAFDRFQFVFFHKISHLHF